MQSTQTVSQEKKNELVNKLQVKAFCNFSQREYPQMTFMFRVFISS